MKDLLGWHRTRLERGLAFGEDLRCLSWLACPKQVYDLDLATVWHGGIEHGVRAIGILAAFAAGILAWPLSVVAQEVIFVVRHSAPPPVLSLDEITDETPLSESGQQRAKLLAERLKDARITVIYGTPARRTVETAEPLAKALGLKVRVHSYDDNDGLVHRLRSEHGTERVLVVGHWGTIPLILKALGHQQEIKIERSAYDNVFVVIPKGAEAPIVLHLHY